MKYARRTVIRDRRLICNHLSTAMTVIVAPVTLAKYRLTTTKVVTKVQYMFLLSLYLAKAYAAYNGWVIKPVAKSVAASPAKNIYVGVLNDGFLHIDAKISTFPVTATIENRALMAPINKAGTPRTESSLWKNFM